MANYDLSTFERNGNTYTYKSTMDLEDLTDISITSPEDGQILKYNDGVWENANDSEGTITDVQVDNVSVVTSGVANIDTMTGAGASAAGSKGLVPAPSAGDENKFLAGDGTWKTGGGSGASALDDLTDVSIDNQTLDQGQILKYNGTIWVNDDDAGGTTVVANPSGAPIGQLNTIQIGEDIYEIIGGGSSCRTVVLWENETGETTGEKTLLDSIDNYDFISVWCGLYSEYTGSPYVMSQSMISVDELNTLYASDIHYTFSGYDNRSTYIDFYGNKANVVGVYNNQTLLKVCGIKIGGSGGSGYTQTLLWDYEDDNEGVIPYQPFSVTLRQSIDNFDELVIENVSNSSDITDQTWKSSGQWRINVDMLNDSEILANYIAYTSYGTRSSRYHIVGTTFEKTANNTSNINGLVRVYGIKYTGEGSGGGNITGVDLTQAQYNQLTPEQKNDPTKMYFVSDGSSGSGGNVITYGYVNPLTAGNDGDLYYLLHETTNKLRGTFLYMSNQWVLISGSKIVPNADAIRVWTKSTGGNNAALYLQWGEWNNGTFTPDPNESTVTISYTDVASSKQTYYNFLSIQYTSPKWICKAERDNLTDGVDVFNTNDVISEWQYSASKDFIIMESE